MAKRKKYSRIKKIEPAVMTMAFQTPTVAGSGGTDSFMIDLSQCASLLNRRFYRQGLNWAVSGIKILTNRFEGFIQISRLPNTWVMSNAWEKGFRAWSKMNKDAMDETTVRPKFLDFKIFADHQHAVDGIAANLRPQDGGANVAVAGEWESSKLLIPLTGASVTDPGQVTEREIIATGPSYQGNGASGLNSVSLIEGYASSRGLPDVLDPNVPADAADADGGTPENWIQALQNQGTQQADEVLGVLIDENNIAPYPFENDGVHTDTQYPGGANQLPALQFHDFEYVTSTTIGGTTRMKGGNFPCGLVRFDVKNDGDTAGLTLIVDLVPGNHRGYLCEPMTEM